MDSTRGDGTKSSAENNLIKDHITGRDVSTANDHTTIDSPSVDAVVGKKLNEATHPLLVESKVVGTDIAG